MNFILLGAGFYCLPRKDVGFYGRSVLSMRGLFLCFLWWVHSSFYPRNNITSLPRHDLLRTPCNALCILKFLPPDLRNTNSSQSCVSSRYILFSSEHAGGSFHSPVSSHACADSYIQPNTWGELHSSPEFPFHLAPSFLVKGLANSSLLGLARLWSLPPHLSRPLGCFSPLPWGAAWRITASKQ